ncbi:MAG: hypothetical protein LBR00_06970 [Clostridiales Family XIII bacterium]|nr:hypothetical protein [Clostridiales Family XIII bacterium]
MSKDKAEVIISQSIIPQPEDHEVSAAWILARHFNCRIEFLKPLGGYKMHTPDFVMNALEWELKSPEGDKRRTIRNNLDLAKEQSPNIIIDTRRTKLKDDWIEAELRRQIIIKKKIYRIIMIRKNESIVEIIRT